MAFLSLFDLSLCRLLISQRTPPVGRVKLSKFGDEGRASIIEQVLLGSNGHTSLSTATQKSQETYDMPYKVPSVGLVF